MPSEDGGGEVDAIQVYIRVRPPVQGTTGPTATLCVETHANDRTISMHCKSAKVFTFDRVIDMEATQEGVFETVGKSLIESCVSGYNGTIFAYGQTGSGKTYTMLGPSEEAENNFQHPLRGVIPRSLDYLFSLINDQIEQQGDKIEFLCKVSFLEIYNEQLYDLLDPVGAASTVLQLREDLRHGVFVDGQIEQAISNAAEAYQVLTSGWVNRTVAETSMNRESSRSHAVFSVRIESKLTQDGLVNVKSSQLNLVDLAGSERQRDTHTTGLRLKEAGKINKSLSALGNVIMALGDVGHGKSRHVPYRDSKLSFLLRDSLGGNAKTNIVACVHPGSKCFSETLSTLQFAQRAKMIKNKAVVNEDSHGNVEQLKAELRNLKEVLAKLRQGIPCDVPAAETDNTRTDDKMDASESGDCSVWKTRFLQAMQFKQHVDEQKLAVSEKQKQLETLCHSKEQALKQMRLVLKFREEALRRLNSAAKEKTQLVSEESQAVIETMREEVKTLEAIVLNHPEISKYQLECRALQAEIKQLKEGNRLSDELLMKKADQLTQYFKQLKAEKDKELAQERRLSQCPSQNPDAVTMATLDRTKAQLSKAQSSLEQARSEFHSEKDRLQQQIVSLTSDIASLKTTNEELKASQLRIQIERDTVEERHMETIKIMTTPKSELSALRSRQMSGSSPFPVLRTASLSSPMTPVTSDPTTSDLISSETVPDDLLEEKLEGLNEEVQRLNDEKDTLRKELENAKQAEVKSASEQSRLASQCAELNKLLDSERNMWTSEKRDLKEELEAHHSELTEAQTNKELCEGEIADLRVMLTQCEKSVKEYRASEKRDQSTIAHHKTTVLQLQVQVSTLEKSVRDLQTDNLKLKEREETALSTLSFTEDKLSSAEDLLQQEQLSKTQLQAKIQEVEDQLSHSQVQLACMQKKGSEVEQQVMEALKEAERYHDDARSYQQELVEVRHSLETQQAATSQLEEKLEKESKLSASLKEVNSHLQEEAQRARDTVLGLSTEVEEVKNEVKGQAGEIERLTGLLNTSELTLNETSTKLRESETKIQQLEFEVANLQEDVAGLLEENKSSLDRYISLQEEHQTLQELADSLTAQKDRLTNEVEELRRLHAAETRKSERMKREADAAVIAQQEADIELSLLRQELSDLIEKADLAERENTELCQARKALSQQVEEIQKDKAMMKIRLDIVLSEKSEVEMRHQASVTQFQELQTSFSDLKTKLEHTLKMKSESEETAQQTSQQLQEVLGDLSELRMKLDQSEKERSQLTATREQVSHKLEEFETKYSEIMKKLELTELERSQASDQLQDLQKKYSEMKDMLEQTESEKEQIETGNKQTCVQLEEMNKELSEMKVNFEQSEQNRIQTEKAREKTKDQFEELQKEFCAMKVKLEETEESMADIETAKQQSCDQLEELQGKFSAMQVKLDETEQGRIQMETENKQVSEQFEELQDENTTTKLNLERTEKERLGLETALQKNNNQFEELQSKFSEIMKKLEQTELERTQAETNKQQTSDQLEDLQKQFKEIKTELEDSKKEKTKHDHDIEVAHNKVAELEGINTAYKQIYSKLGEEQDNNQKAQEHIEKMSREIEDLSCHLEEQEQLTVSLKAECEKLSSSRQVVDETLLQQATAEKDAQLSELHSRLDGYETEADSLKQEKAILLEQAEVHDKERQKLEARCKELEGINAVLSGHANHNQKIAYMQKLQADYEAAKTSNRHFQLLSEKLQRELDKIQKQHTDQHTHKITDGNGRLKHVSGTSASAPFTQNKENVPRH